MSDGLANAPAVSDAPKLGDAWGDDITKERQTFLDGILAAWDAESNHGERKGPFDRAGLSHEELRRLHCTGADVFYLAARSLIGFTPHNCSEPVVDINGARATLRDPQKLAALRLSDLYLQGASLANAKLNGAHLYGAQLDHADLHEAQLAKARLLEAGLSYTDLRKAQLQRANLIDARLEGANLREAHMEDACLEKASLAGCHLDETHMERANLREVKLAGANLRRANLEDADLRFATLDRDTSLNGAILTGVTFDQIELDNTNLTVVSWEGVAPLGDEKRAHAARRFDGPDKDRPKSRQDRITDYEAAVRANRLLSTALRTQGLADDADIFAHRARIMQRKLDYHRHEFVPWSFSWLLALLCGYGYRPLYTVLAYGLALVGFAFIFFGLGVHSHSPEPGWQALWDSFLVSLSAIHGRTVSEELGQWTGVAWVAAVESVFGIVIEGIIIGIVIHRLTR